MSHHDVLHLLNLANARASFRDKPQTRFYRSLRQDQRSNQGHDIAHIHRLTNAPTKYHLPTPSGCRDIAQTRFYRSRSLQQGQRSNQAHAMTTTPNQCP